MISQKITSGLKALVLVSGFGLVVGCASNAAVEQAQADAARALQVAEEAQRTAAQASEAASSAQRAADAAQSCCNRQEEKLDKALERMQQK